MHNADIINNCGADFSRASSVMRQTHGIHSSSNDHTRH